MLKTKKHILIAEIDSEVATFVAKHFAAQGWQVTCAANSKEACLLFSDKYTCFICDFCNRDDTSKLIHKIEQEEGPLDALFMAPKFSMPKAKPEEKDAKDFLNTPTRYWQERLNAWLKTSANLCHALGKSMLTRRYGRIMLLTPDFRNAEGDCIIEATAAGAMHGFIKSFGAEIADSNILVNGIYAGLPFDLIAIAEICSYLAEDGDYVAAQLVSIAGKK